MKRILLAATILLALAASNAANAHNGVVTVDCHNVTFAFTSFPTTPTAVTYTITVDTTTTAGTFTVVGPAATKTVANELAGTHTVTAKAAWTADGGGKAEATVKLDCPVPPSCPAGTSKIQDTPLVCLKETTNTVERIVEKPVEKVVEKIVYVDRPVTVTKTVVKPVVRTVVKYRTVVKWRTRIVKKTVHACPKGMVRFYSHGWKCGAPGSG